MVKNTCHYLQQARSTPQYHIAGPMVLFNRIKKQLDVIILTLLNDFDTTHVAYHEGLTHDEWKQVVAAFVANTIAYGAVLLQVVLPLVHFHPLVQKTSPSLSL